MDQPPDKRNRGPDDADAGERSVERSWFWRFLQSFLIAAALLTALRGALPYGLRAYTNRVLAGLEGYEGRVGDIDVHLWRGAYSIVDLELFKRNGDAREPFVSAAALELEVQWGGLLRGKLVTEAIFRQPVVNFIVAESEAESQTGSDTSWAEQLDALLPFQVNRFAVRDGELRFRDETTDPRVDMYMSDFYLEALNISNVRTEKDDLLPAEVEAAGRPFGTGEFEARVRFDPVADPLRFELDASMRKVQMTDLNDFLQAYGSLDAESGSLGMFAEFAAAEGRVEGYLKTLIEDLDLARFGEIEDPADALATFWDALVGLAAGVLENQARDRLATVVPLSGTLDSGTQVDMFGVIGGLLRNSFIVALRPAINDTLEVRDLMVGESPENSDDLVRRASLSHRASESGTRDHSARAEAGQ